MPENTLGFLLSCLDNCDELEKLQVLLEIALEQFEDRPNNPNQVLNRLEVLIECYRAFAENNINQLQADLQALRNQQQAS